MNPFVAANASRYARARPRYQGQVWKQLLKGSTVLLGAYRRREGLRATAQPASALA